MPPVISTIVTAQNNAIAKGAGQGSHAPLSAANLKILSDKASMPVGVIVAATDYVRFGKIPKGAVIYPNLSLLSSNHTATIAGKFQLVPVDGSAVAQEIPGVVANLEATEATSIPDVANDTVVERTSWIQFVPTADTTIASTAKDIRLRLVYGQTY